MIFSEFLRVLYVVGMVLGIGFCVACILMCVLIGVMVIRACVDYDDDMWDMQPRQVSEEKKDDGAQLDEESEKKWSDGKEEEEDEEENVWLVREKDGWVRKEGKKVYMRVGESEEMDEIR